MTGVPDWNPDAVGAAYVYAAVAEHLTARITAGELAPGARLPGEQELSREYSVALGTIRRALDVLRDQDLVVTLPAKGTFVTTTTRGLREPPHHLP